MRAFGLIMPQIYVTNYLLLLIYLTEEADGNGYGVIAGRGGPSRPPPRASVT